MSGMILNMTVFIIMVCSSILLIVFASKLTMLEEKLEDGEWKHFCAEE
jgi:hypothetical protein